MGPRHDGETRSSSAAATRTCGPGGTASRSGVNSGGVELVRSGGLASGTTVNAGGIDEVFSGGVALGTNVGAGGEEIVLAGGSAGSPMVNNGGTELVFGTATGATVNFGGSQVVERAAPSAARPSAACSMPTTRIIAATESIYGSAAGTTVKGGTVYVYGTATGTTLSSLLGYPQTYLTKATEYVWRRQRHHRQQPQRSGCATRGPLPLAVIPGADADEYVSSGGTAIGAVVSGSGDRAIFGGVASGTIVSSGGFEGMAGGTATGAIVLGGGAQKRSTQGRPSTRPSTARNW